MSNARQTLGRRGEELAAQHLVRLGYQILARNHRTRHGEIDIIAAGHDALVFCEVKTRRSGGDPWDNLMLRKQSQVRRMALQWLREVTDRPRLPTLRFDAIGVVIDARGQLLELRHEEGAF